MPLTLSGLAKVRLQDTGVASSLLNAGQQVGGSIGLAVLGAAWTVVAHSLRAHASSGHAPAAGFSRAFLGGALIMLLALAIAAIAIRVRRADLAGASEPTAEQPDLAPGSPATTANSKR